MSQRQWEDQVAGVEKAGGRAEVAEAREATGGWVCRVEGKGGDTEVMEGTSAFPVNEMEARWRVLSRGRPWSNLG